MADRDPKGTIEDFTGQKSVEKLTDTATKGFKNLRKEAEAIEKIYDKIRGHAEKTSAAQGQGRASAKNPMAGSLGSMGPYAGSNRYAQGPITAQEIGAGGSIGLSTGAKIGLGVMAAGAVGMGIMPSTMSAVSQRLSAEAIAMSSSGRYSGRGIITGANALVGAGNATGIGGPTMAAGQLLSQGGYGFGSATSNRVLGQLGGLSAVSMMSNERAAGAYASMNGMNFLRLGIRLRERDGGLKSPDVLANELYSRIWRGKDPEDPSYDLYNPNSMAYQTIMAAAGGNPDTYQVLASLIMARWKNKKSLTSKQMSSAKTMLEVMGNPKGIMGTNFQYQSSQNRLSQATEVGAVAGYQASLSGAAAINNGLAGMGELLPPVVNGLSALKGVLETMPSAGGAGAMLSGGGSMLMQLAAMRMFMGGGAGAAATAGSAGGVAKGLSGLAKGVPIIGAAVSGGMGYMQAKSTGKFSWGSLLSATAMGAGTGALLGAGTGPGALLTGLIGGLVGGGSNLVGQLLGKGGDEGASSMSAQAAGSRDMALAAPHAGSARISSDYGMRKDPNTGQRKHHNGIDYAMPVGTPILAAADGVVFDIRHEGRKGFGLYLILKHSSKSGDFYTYYGHLLETKVKIGQKVRQGEVIARSGGEQGTANAGSSTGPHLHFEVRRAPRRGTAINPTGLLGRLKNSVSNLLGNNEPEHMSEKKAAEEYGLGSPFFTNPNKKGVLEFSGMRLSELLQAGRPFSYDTMSEFHTSGSFSQLEKSNADFSNASADHAIDNVYTQGRGESNGNMAYGSRKNFIRALYNKGFRGESLETAFAVALAESGGRARAEGDKHLANKKWGYSIGPFQIRSLNDPKKWRNGHLRDAKNLYNPDFNINSAWEISKHGKNWKPWTTYTAGTFTKYLDDAKVAATKAGIGGGDEYGGMGGMQAYGTSGGSGSGSKSTLVVNNPAERNVNVTVNMNVSIANADVSNTRTLVHSFRKALEQEGLLGKIGSY